MIFGFRINSIKPPRTPQQLWIWLASLVALNNIAMSYRTQEMDLTVLIVLVWCGTYICIEDELPTLEPNPTLTSLLLGSTFLFWGLWRNAQMFHIDMVAYGLTIAQGIGLSLLLVPIRQLHKLKAPLLVMATMGSLFLLPVEKLSWLTAFFTGVLLFLIGQDPVVVGTQVWLSGGGVNVASSCSGIKIITQQLTVAMIFALAFPLQKRRIAYFLVAIAPAIAILCNTFRIAILALINASQFEDRDWWFHFLHEAEGSLIFAAMSVSIFAWIYLKALDKQITKKS